MKRTYRKYTKEVLQEAVDNSESIAGVLRYLDVKQAGGTQSHIGRKLKTFDIDTSHFTGQGHMKNKTAQNRKLASEVLVLNPKGSFRTKHYILKRSMIESGFTYECVICKISDNYNNKPITLEIDHINEEWLDNRPENLRFLCPNCHSQVHLLR